MCTQEIASINPCTTGIIFEAKWKPNYLPLNLVNYFVHQITQSGRCLFFQLIIFFRNLELEIALEILVSKVGKLKTNNSAAQGLIHPFILHYNKLVFNLISNSD